MNYCPRCGAQCVAGAVFCHRCGSRFAAPPPPAYGQPAIHGGRPKITVPRGTHSVAMATILSLLLVGTGQMYNKQVLKGFAVLAGSMVLGAVTGCLALIVTIPFAAVDAYKIAERLSLGEAVDEWQFF